MSKELSNNEEVDLGQLFKLIGQGFSNIAASIRRFFNGILDLFINAALFIKKHFIKIAIVTLSGLAFGFYKDYTVPKKYSSIMLVKTNYNATKQLYNEIASINNAFSEYESKKRVIKKLGLTIDDDVFVTIKPIKSDIIQLELFDSFIKKSDTATTKNVDFNKFLNELSEKDYPTQEITITTTNAVIFGNFSDYLITELNKNTLLQKRIEANLKNIEFEEQQLKKSLQDIDSLRVVYNKSLLAEANKLNSGTTTTIITAEQNGDKEVKEVKELALYDKRKETLNLLNRLIIKKAEETQVLQITADFPKYNSKEIKIAKTNTFIYALAAFLLIVLIILFMQFVAYLKTLE